METVFKKPFRLGKQQNRAILDANGKEYVIFPEGNEQGAKDFVDYLNANYVEKEEEKFEKGQLVYISDNEKPVSVICGFFEEKDHMDQYKIKVHGTLCVTRKYCWSKNPLIEEKERGIIIKQRVDGQLVNTHIEEKKEFKPEIGKYYFFYINENNIGFVYSKLKDITKSGLYVDGFLENGWSNISETNPLDK